ncbi:DUF4311 domain-containing protein, partial [Enterococcus faecalis]|uniref:DUF4311 domain-containing protein n=1 Tax=Enterococcus faecalis TaxID=1351 RepID=UPI003D6AAD42
RIVPYWAAAFFLILVYDDSLSMLFPLIFGVVGAFVGLATVAFLNSSAAGIPVSLQVTAVAVLVPAATFFIYTVMPVFYWL